jgi:ADP-ribose pyrophosphatase YjhB (NUDIX family)
MEIDSLHLTVAAVIEKNNKFLLVTDNTSNGYKLNQPAGHVEDGEDIVSAVIREVKEEAGINFYPQKVIGIYLCRLDNKTYLRICFKGNIDGNIDNPRPSPTDDGVVMAHWYSQSELERRSDDFRSNLVKQCIDDYLAGHEFDMSIISPYQDYTNAKE